MIRRNAAGIFACLLAMTAPWLGAQARADSTAVAAALVRHVLAHTVPNGPDARLDRLVLAQGSPPWADWATAMLRAAMPDSLTPRSDSSRYYALRLRIDSLVFAAGQVTVRASWSQCMLAPPGYPPGANIWWHDVAYSMHKGDSGWVVLDQRVLTIGDGRCSVYHSTK